VAVALPPFFTTVVLVLLADVLLVVLWLLDELTARSVCTTGRGGGSILLGIPTAIAIGLSRDVVRVSLPAVAAVLRLACSTMPWMEAEMALVAAEAADLSGEMGLRGEIGRAMKLGFEGDDGKAG